MLLKTTIYMSKIETQCKFESCKIYFGNIYIDLLREM